MADFQKIEELKTEQEKEPQTKWWVAINLTPILVIVLVVGIGFYIKHEYDKSAQQQSLERKQAKEEREAREKEMELALRERVKERDRERKEEIEARLKRADERSKESLARQREEDERKRAERERQLSALKAEEDRREAMQKQEAEKQALEDKARRAEDRARQAKEGLKNKKALIEVAARMCIQYDDALKELNDLSVKLAALESQLTAYKNKMDAAAKTRAGESDRASGLERTHSAVRTTGSGTKVGVDNTDGIAKAKSKAESASKEYADSSAGYGTTRAERDKCLASMNKDKSIVDDLGPRIRALHLDPKSRTALVAKAQAVGVDLAQDTSSMASSILQEIAQTKAGSDANAELQAAVTDAIGQLAPAAPEAKKGAGGSGRTFILKDGTKVVAANVVEAEDQYTVKKEDGKFVTIPKNTVERISDE